MCVRRSRADALAMPSLDKRGLPPAESDRQVLRAHRVGVLVESSSVPRAAYLYVVGANSETRFTYFLKSPLSGPP